MRDIRRPVVAGAVVGLLLAGNLLGGGVRAHEDGHDGTYPYSVEHSGIYDSSYWPGYVGVNWNGWRVYLSPAHHWVGYKSGCDGYVEDLHQPNVATEAAIGAGWDLRARGYYVRVGVADPDEAVTRSDSFGSGSSKRRHISLHSNGSGSTACGGSALGTETFYYPNSSNGEDLAQHLYDKIGAVSAGGKRAGYPDDRTWHELRYTDMPAAYLEMEYHDVQAGVDWLRTYTSWTWRIGYAVDDHLGYP